MTSYEQEKQQAEGFQNMTEEVAQKTSGFFKKAFKDMAESAKAQHEVDKAEFAAVKAESRATFEENRGHNTFARAKAEAKKSWEDAHMTPAQRAQKAQAERDEKIAAAKARTAAAEERLNNAKK